MKKIKIANLSNKNLNAQNPSSLGSRYKVSASQPDYTFIFFILALAVFGLIMLLSASSYESETLTKYPQTFFIRQAGAMAIAMILMFIISFINYNSLRLLSWPLGFIALISLILVEFSPLGISSGGSQRWLNLGPISFQPSEIVKITTLLLMADGLSRFEWKHIEVLKRLAFCLLMCLLVLKEPDLGTSILIIASCGSLMLIGGMNLFLFSVGALMGLGAVTLSILNKPYQLQRFQAWLAPEKDPLNTGYNLLQSYYAIAWGGIFGTGYGDSLHKSGYLPISYADFIFAIICEELGTLGAFIVIGAFIYLLYKGFSISLKAANSFGKLLGLGIVICLSVQTIFNLSGVVGLLPVTGMPLPLISYGKTSLIVIGCMLGILINISRYKRVFMLNNEIAIKSLSNVSSMNDTKQKKH